MNIAMSNLDLAFAALADPTRRRIVAKLTRGETRVTDLALPFDMSLNAVSKHIKVLEGAGLVRRTRVGREHYLRLRAQPLREVARWTSQYERFWTQRLDALGEFLNQQKESENDGS
jgi:DNA-binding transcriptional ArsR family regulator